MTNPLEAVIVALALTGSVLNANKKVEGFLFWIAANLLGMWLFYITGLYFMVGLYAVYTCIALYAIWRWQK
jgi:nicotinamide mononucleotide transporter